MKQINHKTAKVSDLSSIQREHLAWRLDHKTACGYITAGRIMRGNGPDKTLIEIFEDLGDCTHRSASMHAKKVWDFRWPR